jgi:hypothetical protein
VACWGFQNFPTASIWQLAVGFRIENVERVIGIKLNAERSPAELILCGFQRNGKPGKRKFPETGENAIRQKS